MTKKNLQLFIDNRLVAIWDEQAGVRLSADRTYEAELEGEIKGLQEIRDKFLGGNLTERPADLEPLPNEAEDDDVLGDEEAEDGGFKPRRKRGA